jgi:iron complex outermembrane receptor protein
MIRLGLASASAFALLSAVPALAQSNSESTVGEVVVTAQRRAENLQDVPLAVSAFDQNQMDRRQVSRAIDVVTFVPNMEGHNNTSLGTANTYSLRALNNTESIATFDPPVGTYVDDIYVSRQGANNFSFFDVERLEVLRGPQGTLFGRNTTGGAVQIIMRKPSSKFGGFAEAGFGNHDRFTTRGNVDMPITPAFLTKLTAFYTKDDGYVTNQISGEKLNFEDSWGVRFAVQGQLTDKIVWDGSAEWIDAQSTNFVNFKAPGSKKRINFTRLSKDRPLGSIVSLELQDNVLNNEAKNEALTSNFTVTVTDDTTLNIITGYRELNQEFVSDSFDSLNSGGVTFDSGYHILTHPQGTTTPGAQDSTHRQFTQEFKVNGKIGERIDYVGGLYYFHELNRTVLGNVNIPITGATTVSQDRTIRNNTEAYAGYLQVDYHITDQLTATVGGRYTDEHKDIDFRPNPNPLPRAAPAFQPFTNAQLIAAGIPTEQTEKIFTPRFALNYHVNDDLMLFASATRGFKSGGWNAAPTSAARRWTSRRRRCGPTRAVCAPTGWTGACGSTSRASITEVTDTSCPRASSTPAPTLSSSSPATSPTWRTTAWSRKSRGCPSTASTSSGPPAGSTRSTRSSTPPWWPSRRAAWPAFQTTATRASVTPTGGIAEPTRAPEFSSVVGANYAFKMTGDWELVPSVNWSHIKGHYIGTANPALSYQHTRETFNAGITVRNEPNGWSLTADCTNCTNEAYVVSFLIYPYLNEPVRWNVRLRKEF